ncbi:putative E3 ubiquitin-protein ligase-like [Capsicum annuum]|nr:putative E3 ubiquitin-protein ligase-like [Capsicum annuum]
MHACHLTMEVQCKTSEVETVGIAKVSTSYFIGGILQEDYLHFLSYRLRDENGEKNGIIIFVVMVKNARRRLKMWVVPSLQWKASSGDIESSYKGSYVVVTDMSVYLGSLPDNISNLMANKF